MPSENIYDSCNLKDILEEISKYEILDLVFSDDTRTILNDYVNDKLYEFKNLWKNLLLDSICILKINDIRERYNKQFQELYKVTPKFTDSTEFKKIKTYCTYGINDLEEYFEDFVNFEGVLYGTDKNYRDHVNHVLQVWLMGIFFLNGRLEQFNFPDNMVPINLNYSFQVEEIANLFHKNKDNPVPFDFPGLTPEQINDISTKLQSKLYITKSEILASWTVISLCHDLGYPIEKATKLNEKLKKILKYFGASKFEELHYDFGLLNQFLVQKYLDFISSKVKMEQVFNLITNDPAKYQLKKEVGYTALQPKYKDKFAKSLEEFKHGIFSGLLLFKTLTYFLESDYTYNNSLLPIEDLRQFQIRKNILRAISSHTCPKVYHLDIKNLSFLLVTCDELQEWDRPNFDDLRTRLKGKFHSMNVDKIDFSQEISELRLSLTYEIDELKDIRSKDVARKLRMFHQLLRSAKDDANRSFIFRWKIKFKIGNTYRIYRFRFDSSKNDDIETIKITEYNIDNTNTITDNPTDFNIFS